MIQGSVKSPTGVEEGAVFRRGLGGAMIEIAEVVEVGRDRMGIPHVRFNAHLMRGSYKASASEQRTLALESFCTRFKERIRD
jgi:hypothetical protein